MTLEAPQGVYDDERKTSFKERTKVINAYTDAVRVKERGINANLVGDR